MSTVTKPYYYSGDIPYLFFFFFFNSILTILTFGCYLTMPGFIKRSASRCVCPSTRLRCLDSSSVARSRRHCSTAMSYPLPAVEARILYELFPRRLWHLPLYIHSAHNSICCIYTRSSRTTEHYGYDDSSRLDCPLR